MRSNASEGKCGTGKRKEGKGDGKEGGHQDGLKWSHYNRKQFHTQATDRLSTQIFHQRSREENELGGRGRGGLRGGGERMNPHLLSIKECHLQLLLISPPTVFFSCFSLFVPLFYSLLTKIIHKTSQ